MKVRALLVLCLVLVASVWAWPVWGAGGARSAFAAPAAGTAVGCGGTDPLDGTYIIQNCNFAGGGSAGYPPWIVNTTGCQPTVYESDPAEVGFFDLQCAQVTQYVSASGGGTLHFTLVNASGGGEISVFFQGAFGPDVVVVVAGATQDVVLGGVEQSAEPMVIRCLNGQGQVDPSLLCRFALAGGSFVPEATATPSATATVTASATISATITGTPRPTATPGGVPEYDCGDSTFPLLNCNMVGVVGGSCPTFWGMDGGCNDVPFSSTPSQCWNESQYGGGEYPAADYMWAHSYGGTAGCYQNVVAGASGELWVTFAWHVLSGVSVQFGLASGSVVSGASYASDVDHVVDVGSVVAGTSYQFRVAAVGCCGAPNHVSYRFSSVVVLPVGGTYTPTATVMATGTGSATVTGTPPMSTVTSTGTATAVAARNCGLLLNCNFSGGSIASGVVPPSWVGFGAGVCQPLAFASPGAPDGQCARGTIVQDVTMPGSGNFCADLSGDFDVVFSVLNLTTGFVYQSQGSPQSQIWHGCGSGQAWKVNAGDVLSVGVTCQPASSATACGVYVQNFYEIGQLLPGSTGTPDLITCANIICDCIETAAYIIAGGEGVVATAVTGTTEGVNAVATGVAGVTTSINGVAAGVAGPISTAVAGGVGAVSGVATAVALAPATVVAGLSGAVGGVSTAVVGAGAGVSTPLVGLVGPVETAVVGLPAAEGTVSAGVAGLAGDSATLIADRDQLGGFIDGEFLVLDDGITLALSSTVQSLDGAIETPVAQLDTDLSRKEQLVADSVNNNLGGPQIPVLGVSIGSTFDALAGLDAEVGGIAAELGALDAENALSNLIQGAQTLIQGTTALENLFNGGSGGSVDLSATTQAIQAIPTAIAVLDTQVISSTAAITGSINLLSMDVVSGTYAITSTLNAGPQVVATEVQGVGVALFVPHHTSADLAPLMGTIQAKTAGIAGQFDTLTLGSSGPACSYDFGHWGGAHMVLDLCTGSYIGDWIPRIRALLLVVIAMQVGLWQVRYWQRLFSPGASEA